MALFGYFLSPNILQYLNMPQWLQQPYDLRNKSLDELTLALMFWIVHDDDDDSLFSLSRVQTLVNENKYIGARLKMTIAVM